MARDFDGADDRLTTANNAVTGIDVAQRSFAFWILMDAQPSGVQVVFGTMTAINASDRVGARVFTPNATGFRPRLTASATTNGNWTVTSDVTLNEPHHVVMTYDRSATTNDPTIYLDGTPLTVGSGLTRNSAPGGPVSTGDDTIRLGETTTGTADFNGTIGWVVLDADTLWTSDEVNRHRWWGMAPGGPSTMEVWYPFVTDDLKQKGTDGGDLTAVGTTVVSLPRVQRPGSAMMGLGCGI